MTDRETADLRDDLVKRILEAVQGRQIHPVEGADWGDLFLPAPGENPGRVPGGLRILAIGATTGGFLLLETLKFLERRLPGKVSLVGLVTDDPVDHAARISKKRRIWRYYPPEEQEVYEAGIIESALTFGVPCYTGEVKCDAFRKLLAEWDPQLIVVMVCGQILDRPILEYPGYGIYNIHPADLLRHHGAGPQPWEDVVQRKAKTTRTTLHWISEALDAGHVVGQSPPINVRLPDGSPTDDLRLIGEKTLVPVDHMVAELVLAVLMLKDEGRSGPVDHIDFATRFSPAFRKKLMEPIDPSRRGGLLPLPSDELRFDF